MQRGHGSGSSQCTFNAHSPSISRAMHAEHVDAVMGVASKLLSPDGGFRREFITRISGTKAKASNPKCEVDIKTVPIDLNKETPPKIDITYKDGTETVFHPTYLAQSPFTTLTEGVSASIPPHMLSEKSSPLYHAEHHSGEGHEDRTYCRTDNGAIRKIEASGGDERNVCKPCDRPHTDQDLEGATILVCGFRRGEVVACCWRDQGLAPLPSRSYVPQWWTEKQRRAANNV